MIKIGAKQDQRLIKNQFKTFKTADKTRNSGWKPFPSCQLSPRIWPRQPCGLRHADADESHRATLQRTSASATREPLSWREPIRAWHVVLRDGSARGTADHWRGFILSVHLIKWFNPTADIKSCWLYIRVEFGTLEHTEYTPKNSKKIVGTAQGSEEH